MSNIDLEATGNTESQNTDKEIINLFNSTIDKGNLTSRQNGSIGGRIGGQMTKKLVELGEKHLSD